MPYRKYNRRPRSTWIQRARPYVNTASTVAGIAAKTAALGMTVYKMKQLMNVEFKSIDVEALPLTPTPTGIVSLLNASIQGDDFDNRDGRQIRFKSIRVALNIRMNASATQTSMRAIIVLDKQPNGILMVLTDLLTAVGITQFRNLDNRKRFVILWNRVVNLSDNGSQITTIQYYKKLNMHTTYDDSNNGNITDIETNAMYLVLISTEATNTPSVFTSVRMRFIDN